MMTRRGLAELLGYNPSPEQKRMILKEAREKGEPIEKVADSYAMPPLFILNEDGKIEYRGEVMTAAEFKRRFPFRRYVVVGDQERMNKKNLLNNK